MSLSTIPRGPRTILVGIALMTLYLGYSQLTAPWLKIEQKPQHMTASSPAPEHSPDFLERAEMWFKEDPKNSWVKNANARFGGGSRFMYFQNYELFNDDRSIKVDPIAMLWEEDKSDVPYTLTATSAQLDASTKFKLGTNEFGPISSGQLLGDVRITGPGGLRIEGRTFSVSDNALKVTSSQPVKFWWGEHSGIAQSGAEIDLLQSGDTKKQGLMSITDVKQIRLLGRVECDLFFPGKDGHSEAVKLKINAAGGFDFLVATRQATFRGVTNRKVLRDNQVLVERPTISGGLDQLFCSTLTLQFQPAVREAGAGQKRSTKLQLASIHAEGSRVIFSSPEQELTATMSWLKYKIEERVMELSGGHTLSTGRPEPVQIYQKSSMLTATRVVAAHDVHNQIHTIECSGPGRIEQSDLPSAATPAEGAGSFEAEWTDSSIIRQSPEQRVTLKGLAKISRANTSEIEQGMSLSGDVIEMIGTQAIGTQAIGTQATDTGMPASRLPGKKSGLDLSQINPKELTAVGNVVLTHKGVTGHIRKKLTVNFAEDAAGSDSADKIRTVSQSQNRTEPSEAQGTTEFDCDTAKASINFMRGADHKAHGSWSDVWLFGEVQIQHSGVKKDSDFAAKGNALSAKSGFSEIGEISLFGDPAVARLATRRVEGPRIDLRESLDGKTGVEREASVAGSGSLWFSNEIGLDGKPSQQPSEVEIYWTDSMTYSDRTASFIGNIRAVMTNNVDHKVELTCASMNIRFIQDMQFQPGNRQKNVLQAASAPTDEAHGPIELIECNSKVVVDIKQLKDGVVESRNYAEFSDLTVNMITGVFDATGSGSSGIIESTHPNSKDSPRTKPRAVARANTPVSTPTDAFVFVQARFIGSIEGNYKQRFVQLKQHVRGVFGPVRQMGDRIVLDGLNVNELPPNTGSLRCENLSFSQIESGDREGAAQFSMVAESNTSDGANGTHAPCHLESIEISGDADRITYDSSKQQFILRADKGRQATVSYRRTPGDAPETLSGQQFEYYRDRNQLRASEITGVQTAGDLKSPGR